MIDLFQIWFFDPFTTPDNTKGHILTHHVIFHWFHLRFITWASTNAVRVRQALWVYTVINSSKFVDRIIQTSCWAWFDRAADPLGWDTKTSFIFGYNLLLILDRHPRVTWSNPVINYRGYNGLQKYQRKSYAILFLATSANHMIDWFHNIEYYSYNLSNAAKMTWGQILPIGWNTRQLEI